MEGKRLLHKLRLTNLLSYGPEGVEIELEPLNVLIGPNGSGKSNLLEAISLLNAAPTDISVPIRKGGGMAEWVWKGQGAKASADGLSIEVIISAQTTLRYCLELENAFPHIVADEVIEPEQPRGEDDFLYRWNQGNPLARRAEKGGEQIGLLGIAIPPRPDLRSSFGLRSVLSILRDPIQLPQLTYLGASFQDIRLFRTAGIGAGSAMRGPQRADQPASFLLDDGSNLGIVLNDLVNQPATKRTILNHLQRFYPYVEDVTTKVYANTVETYFHEKGFSASTPSLRLSDGTLRYLCLLCILCHPNPPPLVCIEDPEIGLHPDVLPALGELLIEASQRMQLIVTTHSDILVSALSDVPEAVVVCERDDRGSHLRRLDAGTLDEWLEKYTLGELWRMGEVGGNL
jgi:predicted ATPase